MKTNPKDFYASQERFTNWMLNQKNEPVETAIELSNCNWQIISDGRCIEHWHDRIGNTYMIQIYSKGAGFDIYKCVK